jgi:hypothetical protein
MAPRRRLIVQARHPTPNRRQGLAGHRRWQRCPLGLRERDVQGGVVAGDQAAQPGRSSTGPPPTSRSQRAQCSVRARSSMRARSPMKSKSATSTGRPWRNPTLLSQKSPWTSWRAAGRPAPDPLDTPAHPGRDIGGLQVVGELWPPSLLADLQVQEQVVDLGQQRHPNLQALPGVHDRVMVHRGPARVNLSEADPWWNHCVVAGSSFGWLIHTIVGSAGGSGSLRTKRSGCSA